MPITSYSPSEGECNFSVFEGAQDVAPAIFEYNIALPNSKRAKPTKLIVGYGYSKKSFHFCKACRIFREGVKDSTIGISSNNGFVGLIGLGLVGFISFGLNSLVGLSGNSGLVNQISLISLGDLTIKSLVGLSTLFARRLISLIGLGNLGLTSLAGINGIGLVGLSLISRNVGFIGLSISFIDLGVSFIGGFVGFVDLCLVSLARLIDGIGLIGLGGHDGIIGLSLIGGFVGFVGLGLVSLGGLISDISIVGILGLSLISHYGLIDFIDLGIECLISLVGLNGHISLVGLGCFSGWRARAKKKMWYSDNNATAIPAAATRTNGVATKITNAALWYYCAAYYWFVREGLLWHVPGLDSDFCLELALQNGKQLFCNRIPQMTKYCVMRECENIHSWISLIGDLVFSHQQGIYDFKFPKRFLEISSRDLTSSLLLLLFS